MVKKTAKGLVEYAIAQLDKPYWYGTFGTAASKSLYDSKKKQYPSYYEWEYDENAAGVKVHDCVGLIKGYLWGDSHTDTSPKYNSSQDVSANGMLSKCEIKGAIATIPDVPGVLVFKRGHVGVYIGDGYVVEARGHAYGVVKTKLSDRKWTNWGYCPFLTYDVINTETNTKEVCTVNVKKLSKGCKGNAVKALQTLLIGYGYSCGKSGVDGSFGGATLSAVKKYQGDKGLSVDGVVGAKTWGALLGV